MNCAGAGDAARPLEAFRERQALRRSIRRILMTSADYFRVPMTEAKN